METLRIYNMTTDEVEEINEKDVLEMANKIIEYLTCCSDEEFAEDVISAIINCEPLELEDYDFGDEEEVKDEDEGDKE